MGIDSFPHPVLFPRTISLIKGPVCYPKRPPLKKPIRFIIRPCAGVSANKDAKQGFYTAGNRI